MLKSRFDKMTLAAFIAAFFIGGFNPIAVRFTVMEMPPFWAAALRFAPAALIMLILSLVKKQAFPTGRALVGTIIYGALNSGLAYIFIYWGCQKIPPGLAAVVFSLGPLLTLLLAVAQRQERFQLRSLIGSLLAVGGVAVVFLERTNEHFPVLSILAVGMGAVCISESNVVFKKIPQGSLLTTNTVAISSGLIIQIAAALLFREPFSLPAKLSTWTALIYTSLFGTCLLFSLLIYLLRHWTASRTAYYLVLKPFVTLPVSAVLDHEIIGWIYASGILLIFIGVYIGTVLQRRTPALVKPIG